VGGFTGSRNDCSAAINHRKSVRRLTDRRGRTFWPATVKAVVGVKIKGITSDPFAAPGALPSLAPLQPKNKKAEVTA